ncbi:hypothetical protein HS088_TW09G00568 [Tripterygium wilfordii]|uniref:Uncharacterized protein n=1 Tax=Tripterygium wilfordii TaxID=458696 RepID=A0A7J7D8A4_TRIWF|nr:hypothetical protein HS088_TW09G00568 [Tripterygium wilfordii]
MSTKPEEFRNLDFDQDPFCLHQTKNEEETRRTRHQTLAFSYYLLLGLANYSCKSTGLHVV